jgi:hypothetical protein
VPPGNLEPQILFDFAVADFEAVWDALVGREPQSPPASGANFLLAKHAVLLLELCSRVASDNGGPGLALRQFSDQLRREERRYFRELPCDVRVPRDFSLPGDPARPPERQLLALIYDLVRNGQAHYYQQIPATLADGSFFGISLTGADPGRPTFDECRHDRAYRARHLTLNERDGSPWLVVRPEALFIDVMLSARRASLFTGTLPLARFTRRLDCSSDDLRAALVDRS